MSSGGPVNANAATITFKLVECLIAALRDFANMHEQFTEEWETFQDAADALDDALELMEDLNVA